MNNQHDAMQRALVYLNHNQPTSGDFPTILPSLIAQSLAVVPEQSASDIGRRIADYLIEHKRTDWSFGLWESADTESDIYSTFCALSALYANRPNIFNGDAMADIAHHLFGAEIREGGPYAVKGTTQTDVLVNTQIALFLSMHDVELPNLTRYFEICIDEENFTSCYAASIYPAIYEISRVYNGPLQSTLNDVILRYREGDNWDNPHNTALCMLALIRNGYKKEDLRSSYEYLIENQQEDGNWPAGDHFVVPNASTKIDSNSLTTALCCEVLAVFSEEKIVTHVEQQLQHFYANVQNRMRQKIDSIGSASLRESVANIYERIMKRDEDRQIVLVPYLVAKDLASVVPPVFQEDLAMMNVWNWMAYTTYDDFLDGEGNRLSLPGANFSIRQLYSIVATTLPGNKAFQIEAHHILNRIDAANAWEIAHCRRDTSRHILETGELPDYGDYWQLADRSLSHMLPGLGVLHEAGYRASSDEMQALRDFFYCYLIGRQLNDDIHDWEEDLCEGHINAIGAQVLKKWEQPVVTFQKDLPSLRAILWEDILESACIEAENYLLGATEALSRTKTTANMKDLGEIADKLRKETRETRHHRKHTIDFLHKLGD